MKSICVIFNISKIFFLLSFLTVSSVSFAGNQSFDRIVVFGASLSDPGNVFVLLSNPELFDYDENCDLTAPANTPPYDALDDFLIPDGSYAIGGHHVSNGATWIEQFARSRGLSGSVRPALRATGLKASNYAVGGARATTFPCRFNLQDQLDIYFSDFSETSADTLVVIEIGGNDVRDALAGAALGLDPIPVLTTAIDSISETVQDLYAHGARNFLLMNVPAIGKTPAVKMIDVVFPGTATAANQLTVAFNFGLAQLQFGLNSILPEVDIRTIDLYALLNDIISTPESFGIINTEDACITPNIPPFKCKKPDTYLFWDGIHPTKAVHGIMAQRAAEVLFPNIP